MPRKGSGITSATRLMRRCVTHRATGCWEWTGAFHRGAPRLWVHDPQHGRMCSMNGHRAAAIFAGLDVGPGRRAWMRCLNPACVAPHHAMSGTMAEWGAFMAESEVWRGNLTRVAIMTAAVRKSSVTKLDMAAAREIRSMSGVTQREMSEMFGVGVKTISDVRRWKSWREASPFTGLGAR